MEALGFGCRDMGLVFSISAQIFATILPVLRFGSEHLRDTLLKQVAGGKIVAAHAATEVEAGSDVFSMRTQAVREGDEYLINGSKCFVTNAPEADLFVVFARTKPGTDLFGISAFLVDRDTPGVQVSKAYDKNGLRGSPTGDVFFDNCRIPAIRRLGGEGQGARIFIHSMNWERVGIMCTYVGSMERQLNETIKYARTRKQFGRAIKDYQGVSHKIADMKVRLETARLVGYRAAWSLENEATSGISIESAVAKLVISEAAVQSSLDAMQVHGGLGVMTEAGVERHLRDALPSRVFSGTSEILRNTIANGLGLNVSS